MSSEHLTIIADNYVVLTIIMSSCTVFRSINYVINLYDDDDEINDVLFDEG